MILYDTTIIKNNYFIEFNLTVYWKLTIKIYVVIYRINCFTHWLIFTFPLYFSSINHIDWHYVHSRMNTVISDSFIQFTWILIFMIICHIASLFWTFWPMMTRRCLPAVSRARNVAVTFLNVLLLCYISSIKLLFWKK